MSERHDRSVKSTFLTIMEYTAEIKSLLSKEDEFNEHVKSRLSPEDSEAVANVLANIEGIIRNYWVEAGLQGDDLNIQWRILVMSEFMENLLSDIRPERLGKTHGEIESADEVKRLDRLCDDLYSQAQRLKDLSLKK